MLLLVSLWSLPAWSADDRVTLNFQNADIGAVVKMMSQVTGRNFVIDPKVKGTVTIVSSTPIPRQQAYQVFLSALRVQGFTAVEGKGYTKIIPESDAKLTSMPLYSNRLPRRDGDRMVTQIYKLRYESANQLVPVLRPLISPNNYIAAYPATNTLVITDYADNVRRIGRIIESIDQPSNIADVTVIPLHHTSAVDMAQLLTRLMVNRSGTPMATMPGVPGPVPVPGAEGAPSSFAIVPDMRTNSLLVRTDSPARLLRLRTLVATLDVPASNAGNIHVVYLRNARATKLAEVLRGLLTGEQQTSAGTHGAASTLGGGARPATLNTSSPNTESSAFGNGNPAAGAGGAPASGPVSRLSSPEASMIQADPATNSLLIVAPDSVYNSLRSVIDQLDVRRAQVYVEALIAEVSSDQAAEFGLQWQALNNGSVFGQTNFNTPAGAPPFLGAGNLGPGLNIGYLRGTINIPGYGDILNLAGLARALESDSNVNILSTPNLITLDNSEAKIVVGQNVPFVTGSYAQAAGTGTAVNPFQTIERKDVGLTLKIKPQITEGGVVKLQIYQEVSSLATRTAGAADVVTNKRALESTVLVDDGGIIVLGGLIQDNVQDREQRVPFLGRLPILGSLFRYDNRTRTKTNLMIFLRPYIIRNSFAAQSITEDRYDYIRGLQQQMPMPDRPPLPYMTPPALPPFKVNPPQPLPNDSRQQKPTLISPQENGQ